ncbi:MAG: hypothetical protein IT444_08860 [Phycisphaeraceae bacterium]|nr:hypothetical protein [Phycisphaeraceae bacterium]
MTFAVDQSMHWADHYVEYGFAVIKGVVGPEFIDPALAEVCRLLDHENLPLKQWTKENTPTRSPVPISEFKVCNAIYDQPGIRRIIDTMFGSPDQWNGQRAWQLFVTPYDTDTKAELSKGGHIDFVETPIPTFGSGFMFQVSLVKSEPFSGNITILPGTHKLVQMELAKHPEIFFPSNPFFNNIFDVEPFEFVAEPGDVLLFHHLVGHSGNNNHATNRSPRITLHCQGLRKEWMKEIDPSAKGLSPWQRSLAFTGGPHRLKRDEEQWIMEYQKTRKTKPKVAAY